MTMTTEAPASIDTRPLQQRLTTLAQDYDEASAVFHDDGSIRRAAAQLRLVRVLVNEGIYSYTDGYAWLLAGRKILARLAFQRKAGLR